MNSPLKVYSNRYEIVRPIARGGMADVYLARDQLLNRPVALKVLFAEFARESSFVERFRREAQAAANLNHPNIVGIYDWGQEQGTYFIAMEYVEGRSLREVLSSQGRLSAAQAAEIGAEIGAALSFAHRNGVVHRDVKPGNVLLTTEGQVKVTDFGIARAGTADGLTQTGSVMGTATYFSPEQAQGITVDGRSDVYSLGIVLYEMVAGKPPFVADSPVAVAYKQVQEQHVPLAQVRSDLPPDFIAIVDRALAKRVTDRYQSAEDLRSDLSRFRRGQKISHAAVTGIVAEMNTGEIQRTPAPADAARTEMQQSVTAPQRVPNDWEYDMQEGSTFGRRLGVFAVILVALGLIGAVVAVLLSGSGDSKPTTVRNIEIPGLVGQSETDAISALENKGFTNIDDPRTLKSDEPIGTVIAQLPAAGDVVASNTRIRLDVSGGPETVRVPSGLEGVSTATAEGKLKNANLRMKPTLESSDDVGVGLIIRTEPEAGQSVPINSEVTVVVSIGKANIDIPKLEGQDVQSAKATLAAKGFTNVTTTQQASNTVEKDLVINTDPAFGETATKDEQITIYISTGPATKDMVDVVGMDEASARNTLQAAGFLSVSTIEGATTDPSRVGKVIGQSPRTGPWDLSKPVTLTIGVSTGTSSSSSSSSSSIPAP